MARAHILGSGAAQALEGAWEIAALPPGGAAEPHEVDALQLLWTPCDGPMPVAAALRGAGQLNLDHPRDLDADDWWYRCRFQSHDPSAPARLRFEGLATVADVWLNRAHILRSESMFVAHTVDVGSHLRADNELDICFHALSPLLAGRRPRPRWRTRLVANQGLRWYRTSLLGRIPSWCPSMAPVGPWRPILIEAAGPLRIDQTSLRASFNHTDGVVRVSFRATCPDSAEVTGSVAVDTWDTPLACVRVSPAECVLSATARVPRPDRWWPHTHGPQPLYHVRASVVVGDRAQTIDLGRIGFRTIDVDRGADGRGFGLVVNGAPVFCRGVCWTPLDLASLAADTAGYRAALEQLRDAGMNMVRVGGTTTYEADVFHDLCDELGILVWQDFMFANMDYPSEDEAFSRDVTREAEQALEALHSRPSLAVLCGSSEVEQQASMLGLPAPRRSNPLFDERLPALVRAMAPGTPWLPSTPTGGDLPFQVNSGVSHYFGVGAYLRPFEDARRAGVRFAAECLAFSNIPDTATIDLVLGEGEAPGHHPRWKVGVPRDAGVGWDFEDVRDHYLALLFGVNPNEVRSRDPMRYLALGRVATGEAMWRTFAEWRRPGSPCRGGLVWFARDLRPGAGWGVVDSTGAPKAPYWYLKRALAPIALLAADEGLNGLWLHAVNDTAEPIQGELRVVLYRDGARRGVPGTTTLSIPARGSRSVHADALFEGFLDLTYAYRFGPPGHDVVAATLRDSLTGAVRAGACYFPRALPSEPAEGTELTARAEPSDEGYTLVLEATRFVHAVAIEIEGYRPADNYLHLEPGETTRVVLRATMAGAIPRGTVTALNARGAVSVVVAEAANAR